MKCDVVFITPNTGGQMYDESFGTLQLVSILTEKGISCDILPFFKIGNVDEFDTFVDNALDLIRERQCRIVSFYTRCDCYHVDLWLARRVKETFPDIYIVCGGPQSDITAEATVGQLPYVDFVCCGEGETTVYPFFASLLQGTPDLSVDGLVYRERDQVRKNPRPALLEDLDCLPMIDYSLLKTKEGLPSVSNVVTIDVGRGCPFACSFCSTNAFWGRKYRLKSPQRICQEVELAHRTIGNECFEFAHDMFTLNREKVMETCRLLKQLDFSVRWNCSARLDCLDRELIDVMVDAGLQAIFIGIETGSPRMQKLIHKNLKLDGALDLIGYMVDRGLMVTASFVFAFPEETEEDFCQTLAMMAKLMRLDRVIVHAHLCAFMVGTELTRRYAAELTPAEYYSDQTGEHAVKECHELISQYPDLFQQMLEYKTELRTKLRHFPLFLRVWERMRPVYNYLSLKYTDDRIIDMYDDFVKANAQKLQTVYDMNVNWCSELILHDKFPEQFADDACYDRIAEYYRYTRTLLRKASCSDGTVSGVFSFNPREMERLPLLQWKRCVAVVTWKAGKRSIACYPYIPK